MNSVYNNTYRTVVFLGVLHCVKGGSNEFGRNWDKHLKLYTLPNLCYPHIIIIMLRRAGQSVCSSTSLCDSIQQAFH
jgi:hypothetical protein